MWLFTEEGFYSAVATDRDPDLIVVRARDRDDLVRLLDVYWAVQYYRPEILDEGGDYPHRVVMARDDWARIVQEAAAKIDYTNFKDHIAETLGHDRAHTYLRVWSALLELEVPVCSECGMYLSENEKVLCGKCLDAFNAEADQWEAEAEALRAAEALAASKARHPGKKAKKKAQRVLRLVGGLDIEDLEGDS